MSLTRALKIAKLFTFNEIRYCMHHRYQYVCHTMIPHLRRPCGTMMNSKYDRSILCIVVSTYMSLQLNHHIHSRKEDHQLPQLFKVVFVFDSLFTHQAT